MNAKNEKARENVNRRLAKRLGLFLKKSRKGLSFDNQGGYMLINPYTNILLYGPRFDLDLDMVEKILKEYKK